MKLQKQEASLERRIREWVLQRGRVVEVLSCPLFRSLEEDVKRRIRAKDRTKALSLLKQKHVVEQMLTKCADSTMLLESVLHKVDQARQDTEVSIASTFNINYGHNQQSRPTLHRSRSFLRSKPVLKP